MHKAAVVFALGKLHNTFCYCKNSVVFTHVNAPARVVIGATLAQNDIARNSIITAEYFNAEALAVRIAAVLYFTFTFFMCHDLCFKTLAINYPMLSMEICVSDWR